VSTFGIHGDKIKSINLCLNRFDDDTKASFVDLYTKIDAGINPDAPPVVAPQEATTSEEIPF
jgi:hypothetical protein